MTNRTKGYPMTDIPSDYTADPSYQLGYAKELLRCVIDPHDIGAKIMGPEHLKDRIREFLGADAVRVMGPAEQAARTAVAALRLPWPHLATNGLYPGDLVTHPTFGAGHLAGFDDDEWPKRVMVVASGVVLVEFDQGRRWLDASTLTAVDGERDADWQRRHEIAEQTYLRDIEHAQYEGA